MIRNYVAPKNFYLFGDMNKKLYCAPKQAKHEKIYVFRPVSEQNFIPE
jgi:hypothetical protein